MNYESVKNKMQTKVWNLDEKKLIPKSLVVNGSGKFRINGNSVAKVNTIEKCLIFMSRNYITHTILTYNLQYRKIKSRKIIIIPDIHVHASLQLI